MLVETDNLVTAEEFRAGLEKYVAAAQQGCGPIAVTQNSEVIGFFVEASEYEAMFGVAVRDLLTSRAKGPSLTQKEAHACIRQLIEDRRRKP